MVPENLLGPRKRFLVFWIVWLALLAIGFAQVSPVRLCLQIEDHYFAVMVDFYRFNLAFSISYRTMFT
jgi:hypothetical protein